MQCNFMRLWGVAAVAVVAACAGGQPGGGTAGNAGQVVVRLDGDISDVDGATRVADRTCATRGGRARFIALVSPPPSFAPRIPPATANVPEAVFTCDPAPR